MFGAEIIIVPTPQTHIRLHNTREIRTNGARGNGVWKLAREKPT